MCPCVHASVLVCGGELFIYACACVCVRARVIGIVQSVLMCYIMTVKGRSQDF